jgi:pimeloyl-ACP methyl ester carboxylesterase
MAPPGNARALVGGQELEYSWVGSPSTKAPLVFLHEGLGSIELWREFPERICFEAGRRGLVYSRHGNGWSQALDCPRPPDYMHEEAQVVLPELITSLVGEPPVLIGHSDGASIAIIYAGMGHPVTGLVLIAPHVVVEEESIAAITAVRLEFASTDLRDRMAKYHRDPVATFRGWNDAWLSPAFRDWNLGEFLPGISSPTLLVQGEDDQFGTLAQLDSIERQVSGPTRRLVLSESGHSPHLVQPDIVTEAVIDFLTTIP